MCSPTPHRSSSAARGSAGSAARAREHRNAPRNAKLLPRRRAVQRTSKYTEQHSRVWRELRVEVLLRQTQVLRCGAARARRDPLVQRKGAAWVERAADARTQGTEQTDTDCLRRRHVREHRLFEARWAGLTITQHVRWGGLAAPHGATNARQPARTRAPSLAPATGYDHAAEVQRAHARRRLAARRQSRPPPKRYPRDPLPRGPCPTATAHGGACASTNTDLDIRPPRCELPAHRKIAPPCSAARLHLTLQDVIECEQRTRANCME